MNCSHHWMIDRENQGECSNCGEIRQFPRKLGIETKLIKPGVVAVKPKASHDNKKLSLHPLPFEEAVKALVETKPLRKTSKDPDAVARGVARAAKLTKEQRSEISSKAAKARWAKRRQQQTTPRKVSESEKDLTPRIRRKLEAKLSETISAFDTKVAEVNKGYTEAADEDCYFEVLSEFIQPEHLATLFRTWVDSIKADDKSFARGAIYALLLVSRLFEGIDEMRPKKEE